MREFLDFSPFGLMLRLTPSGRRPLVREAQDDIDCMTKSGRILKRRRFHLRKLMSQTYNIKAQYYDLQAGFLLRIVESGNMKTASKREGENLFTHIASESSLDEVKD